MWGLTKDFGLIGSDVLTFIGYEQTKKKQTDKQSIYIYVKCILYFIYLFIYWKYQYVEIRKLIELFFAFI